MVNWVGHDVFFITVSLSSQFNAVSMAIHHCPDVMSMGEEFGETSINRTQLIYNYTNSY